MQNILPRILLTKVDNHKKNFEKRAIGKLYIGTLMEVYDWMLIL